MTNPIQFRNVNGITFRAVPIEGGYRIQRRWFLLWLDVQVERATSTDIGCGLTRITIEHVPLRCSHACFQQLVDEGSIILENTTC